jgi:hypothetical protein
VSPLPLHRIRLELDRSLRTRAFFVRAIRGELGDDEYRDLIDAVSSLTLAAAGDATTGLAEGAVCDLENLGGCRRAARPCSAVTHFREAARTYATCLDGPRALDVMLALFGSSWSRDASRRLKTRHPRSVSFLTQLGRIGPERFTRVAGALATGALDPDHAYPFAEMARGALFAVATSLECTWPAPTVGAAFTVET